MTDIGHAPNDASNRRNRLAEYSCLGDPPRNGVAHCSVNAESYYVLLSQRVSREFVGLTDENRIPIDELHPLLTRAVCIALMVCFGLLPGMQAVSPEPDRCYPNFTTAFVNPFVS